MSVAQHGEGTRFESGCDWVVADVTHPQFGFPITLSLDAVCIEHDASCRVGDYVAHLRLIAIEDHDSFIGETIATVRRAVIQ